MKFVDRRKSRKGDRYLFFACVSLAIFISSCSQNSLNQCQQIFQIAREIDRSSENIARNQDELDLKSWLEAAQMMEIAADRIQALHIDNSDLIEHQDRLATIYRIYARSTYDAVRARENKNLQALEAARLNALQTDKMHQDSIAALNNYCLNRQ